VCVHIPMREINRKTVENGTMQFSLDLCYVLPDFLTWGIISVQFAELGVDCHKCVHFKEL